MLYWNMNVGCTISMVCFNKAKYEKAGVVCGWFAYREIFNPNPFKGYRVIDKEKIFPQHAEFVKRFN